MQSKDAAVRHRRRARAALHWLSEDRHGTLEPPLHCYPAAAMLVTLLQASTSARASQF